VTVHRYLLRVQGKERAGVFAPILERMFPLSGDALGEMKLEIGGIVLALKLHGDGRSFEMADVYRAFLSDGPSEAVFTFRYGSPPDLKSTEKVFDSGGAWKLYRDQGRWCFALQSPALGSEPYQIAIVDTDFAQGDIYTRAPVIARISSPYPLGYPLEELLFVNLLSQGRGALLHACAVSDNGRGFVFAGTSGAGKSTMADLWKKHEGVAILSDDRVIVREMEGRFWAYGTPWHGDVKLGSPERAPIDGIFVLRHGEENRAAPSPWPSWAGWVKQFPAMTWDSWLIEV
jgi:hypothetical protein